MNDAPRHIRVFLASPGDVAQERRLTVSVIDNFLYDPRFANKVTFEIVAWDKSDPTTPMLANMTPQAAIELGLPKPSESDIVVVIFWTRMGTPFTHAGQQYLSGTHYEYEDAIQAARKRGYPQVLVYRRMEKVLLDPDAPEFQERIEQLRRVQDFFASFQDGQTNQILGGFNEYEKPEDFRVALEGHIPTLVDRLLSDEGASADRQTAHRYKGSLIRQQEFWPGSPFPGLEAFTEAQAPIFFGRGREIDQLLDMVGKTRFVAVVGASGSGKSSLVRAGLIPSLRSNALSSETVGSKDWHLVPFTPGTNPFQSLAEALTISVPALRDSIRGAAQLTDLAETLQHKRGSLTHVMRDALRKDNPWADVLLIIDQFEELFTLTTEDLRDSFADLLTASVASDREARNQLRVILTLRADFFHYMLAYLSPALRAGTFTLDKPDAFALLEMITRPATRARLQYEDGLPEQIVKDTGNEPGALALMAYALDELYKIAHSRGDRRLRFSDYGGLGGVQGAIGKRAKDIFEKLDDASRATLPYVFSELVAVNQDGIPTRKRSPLVYVASSGPADRLVSELTSARLLVQGYGETGAVVEVAHEALFREWKDLALWIADNKSELFLLEQVRVAAALWHSRGRNRSYLWTGGRSEDIQAMLRRLHPRLNEVEREFCRPEAVHLLEETQDIDTPHLRRSEIGFRLSEIGDPRQHIGLRTDGLPDIGWLPVEGAVVKLDGVRGQFRVQPFYIALFPLTYLQFRPFLEDSDGYLNGEWWVDLALRQQQMSEAKESHNNYPRDSVSWFQAMAFTRWINAKMPADGRPSEARNNSVWKIRLPVEWEWQQAATGGHPAGEFYWGAWDNRRCNTSEAGIGRSTAVGMYPHSRADCGAMDMFGNLYEWCLNEVEDPRATSPRGTKERILRGGAFWHDRKDARATYRGYPGRPQDPYMSAGFRLVCAREAEV